MAFASPAFAGLPLSGGMSCWAMTYGPKSGVSSGQLEADSTNSDQIHRHYLMTHRPLARGFAVRLRVPYPWLVKPRPTTDAASAAVSRRRVNVSYDW